MNKKLLILLVILAIFVAGWVLYSKLPTMPVDIATWESYTNTAYNYRFKYPNTVSITGNTPDSSKVVINNKDDYIFTVSPLYATSHPAPNTFIQNYTTELSPEVIKKNENNGTLNYSLELQQTTINGIKAYEEIPKKCALCDVSNRDIYLQQSPGKPVLKIHVNFSDVAGKPASTILSTFGFTP